MRCSEKIRVWLRIWSLSLWNVHKQHVEVFIKRQKCSHSWCCCNLIRAWFLYLACLFLQTLLTNQSRQNGARSPGTRGKKENFGRQNEKDHAPRTTTTTTLLANWIFFGGANWVTAQQNKHAVGFQHNTRSGWQLISVFGLVSNERHSGGIELIVWVLMGGGRARDPSRADSC